MITTDERRETLGRERGRLAKALRKPWLRAYARDKRVVVDALESLVLIDLGGKGHAKEAKKD